MTLDEEMLNAYVDGALDADTRAGVEALIKTDAAARELLEKLRRANTLATEAFDEPMHEPAPQSLIDTILRRPGPDAGRDQRVFLETRAPRSWKLRTHAIPLAAALALAVGIGVGLFLGRQLAQPINGFALGPVPIESPLHRVLESYASGRFLEIAGLAGGARRLGVVATFLDRHARACREVEVLSAAHDQPPLAAGVACRRENGGWVVEGVAQLAHDPNASSQDFKPSGASEKDTLDGLLTMLGAQSALGANEEQALIQRGWK